MGRKAFYTDQQVFACADALASEGKEVTATTLRDQLGGGSFSTIYRHLETWQNTRAATLTKTLQVDIPESVQASFSATWRVAITEAGKEITAAREKAREEVRIAQAQFAEAVKAIESLETDADNAMEKIESLTVKLSETENTLHVTENERAALTATAEQQRQRIEADSIELARLRTELESTRQQRDDAAQASAELRGESTTLKSQYATLLSRFTPSEPTAKPVKK